MQIFQESLLSILESDGVPETRNKSEVLTMFNLFSNWSYLVLCQKVSEQIIKEKYGENLKTIEVLEKVVQNLHSQLYNITFVIDFLMFLASDLG